MRYRYVPFMYPQFSLQVLWKYLWRYCESSGEVPNRGTAHGVWGTGEVLSSQVARTNREMPDFSLAR